MNIFRLNIAKLLSFSILFILFSLFLPSKVLAVPATATISPASGTVIIGGNINFNITINDGVYPGAVFRITIQKDTDAKPAYLSAPVPNSSPYSFVYNWSAAGLTPGNYQIQVRQSSTTGTILAYSSVIVITDPGLCPTCGTGHSEILRSDGNYNVYASWDSTTIATTYKIYFCTGDGCTPALYTAVVNPTTSYTFTNNNLGFSPGSKIAFKVVPEALGCTVPSCSNISVTMPVPVATSTIAPTIPPGATPTPVPLSTPTETPLQTSCTVGLVIENGGWNGYGFGVQTGQPVTFRISTGSLANPTCWKFSDTGVWQLGSDNIRITKTFAVAGDYQILVGLSDHSGSGSDVCNPLVSAISTCTTSNPSGGSAYALVYDACTAGPFTAGNSITSTNGSIAETCTTPVVGGCVGGSSFQVNYRGIGDWGYYGSGSGVTGSSSMRELNTSIWDGGYAVPNFAAYPPPFGFLGQSYGYGTTCFKVIADADKTAELQVVGGSIYCRPGGSCSSGGGPSGPHDPAMVSINVANCGQQSFGYACQVDARASFGTAGTFRFGNINGGTSTPVANEACLDPDGCRFGWGNCGATPIALGGDFMALRSVAFTPSVPGTLDKVRLRMKRVGGGISWVNIKITNDDGCWNDSCVIPPAITGLNYQIAEAGAKIDQLTTFDDWLVFSFAGSQPELVAGHVYRIYAETSSGQNGTLELPMWYSRQESSGACSGLRFGYNVYIRTNEGVAGKFIDATLPGDNPLSDQCPSYSPCVKWWMPPVTGTYTISADLLVTSPSNTYPLTPDKVGKRTTTRFYTLAVTVPSVTPTVTPTMTLTPTPAATYEPWFQTQGGDVHAEGDIKSPIPPAASDTNFSILNEIGGYPGLVTSGLALNNPWSPAGTVSFKGWIANSTMSIVSLYDSIMTKYSPTTTFDCTSGCPTTSGIYITSGVTIDKNWNVPASAKIVVLVDGDLTIDMITGDKIQVASGGFLGFIVRGNINIKGATGNVLTGVLTGMTADIQGIYLAEGNIDTNSDDVFGKRLVVGGMMAAKGSVILGRDLGNGEYDPLYNSWYPSEVFIFRPDLIVNIPASFMSSTIVWQEVTP